MVVLPDTPIEGAVVAAERLRSRFSGFAVTLADGRTLPPVTASIGVAELSVDDDPASLLARADAALYRAKAAGRDRVERG